jgi:hypothetical protein
VPTLLISDGFRFFFSNEGFEPPHVHVEKADAHAKFWLVPLQLSYSHGFGATELKRTREIIVSRRTDFLEKWHEYFHA